MKKIDRAMEVVKSRRSNSKCIDEHILNQIKENIIAFKCPSDFGLEDFFREGMFCGQGIFGICEACWNEEVEE